MAIGSPTASILVFLLHISLSLANITTHTIGGRCNTPTPLAGSEHDLAMVQHQLRGVVTVLDACSFSVRHFDMLGGSDSARWWGALSTDLLNLTAGFPLSDLPLNHTFSNDSSTIHLHSPPLPTLDQIPVLAVWDPSTASEFGHVILRPNSSSSPSPPHQPTSLDNCHVLSPNYRLRWTLNPSSASASAPSIDIALEAAVGSDHYMAFGWGSPNTTSHKMLNSDVVVAGFSEDGIPFADDYYISDYMECIADEDGKMQGVCPDVMYEGTASFGAVNNTVLLYGHRKDGVSFVRYRRLLATGDDKYDVSVHESENMTVIWALGPIRPPDSLSTHYLPRNHGGPLFEKYGYFSLNVSERWDDCAGPLDAEDKEDQDLVFADGNTALDVTTGPAVRYPNPPSPPKVFYINKKEAPVLRAERGVEVKFLVQAGHGVPFYITSDPIGGNATSRNASEIVYAGGAEWEGVPSSPRELVWMPSRDTPDQVYYQSIYEMKMGWKIKVVDGGLSDMYNSSVLLDDQQVSFFWTLSDDSISIAVRGEKKSGYLAVGFGGGMVNSFVYVGWMDGFEKGHVRSYWIDGRGAYGIHPTEENLTDVRCSLQNGFLTFEFTRPLSPTCKGRIECKNVIDPASPLRVIWAMGTAWSEGPLTEKNMHSFMSNKPVRVLLKHGSAEAEQDLRPVLAVHGFMMFVAWGVLLPGGILSARYLKHLKGNGWFRLHVYLQYSGIAIMLLGFLFAAAELRGLHTSSLHVKFGLTAIILACIQPLNACLRPSKPGNGDPISRKRVVWEYFHIITGRCAIVAGVASLISGLKHLERRYDDDNMQELNWALLIWFLVCGAIIVYLEYLEINRRASNKDSFRGSWVLGNEEDDSSDLLQSTNRSEQAEKHASSTRMEVQLEPLP